MDESCETIVSVIVPIYNVGQFIEKCAESLFKQSIDNVEYLFIDDASPDNSIDILNSVIERFPQRKESVSIIRHEENKGLPTARNTGLKLAKGKYIFHCDSDDYVEPNMLEEMVAEAEIKDADIVWSDWFLTFASNERYMKQPDYNTPIDALKGMLGGAMKYNVWNKLVKRSLYYTHNVRFPDGYGMGEDLTMLLLFAHANKVVYLNKAYYHYLRINTSAFSNRLRPEHFADLKHNVLWITKELRKIFGNELDNEIAFLKLESKYPLLVASGSFKNYRLWKEWFPDANGFITANKNVGLRSRIIQLCGRYKQYWIVWLHYQLVCRLIYGVIYK